MKFRILRANLRCARLPRRPYYVLISVFSLLLFVLMPLYIKYVLHLCHSIIFVGDLPSDTLLMTWAGRRPLKEFIKPKVVTEILSPANPYCLKFVVLVTTVVHHFEHRQAIRDTWGRDLHVFFFLGRSADQKTFLEEEAKLAEESAIHEDLIVEDFIDSYYNLTLKTAFMMKWAIKYCPDAEFILKTDDDMFVNPKILKKSAANVSSDSKTIKGRVLVGSIAHHDPESKWYLPKRMYPGDILPDYVSGTAYLMTGTAMKEIYKASMEVAFITLEDILFTGILAKKLNVTLIRDYTYTDNKPPSWNIIQWIMGTSNCGYHHLAAAHRLKPEELRHVWSSVSNPYCKQICSSWFQTKLVKFMALFL